MTRKVLEPEEKDAIGELFWRDPVAFCVNTMPHYFVGSCDPSTKGRGENSPMAGVEEFDDYSNLFIPQTGEDCEMPWVHRGILAIMLRRADWLGIYGQLEEIVSEFVAESSDGTVVNVFRYTEDRKGLEFAISFDQVQCMIPRGTSKTTLTKMAMVALIAYEVVDYFVYVSAASPHAETQIADIKDIINSKPRFTEIYGAQKPAQRTGKPWAADEFETESGVLVGARGVDGQIRGLSVKGRRPKLIILDDIEDEENVATEEQRNKLNRKFHSVIEPALRTIYPPNDPYPPTLLAINTLLSEASLNGDFLKSEYWLSIRFGAKDKQGRFWFPIKMDAKEYEKKRKKFLEAGQLHTFHLEYDNKSVSEQDQLVIQKNIKVRGMPDETPVWNVLACDPAISEDEKADEATLTVAALDSSNSHIYVRENKGKQGWHVSDYLNEIFTLVSTYNIQLVGVESNAYQAVLLQLLQVEMMKRNVFFTVVGLTHHKKKEARVKGWLQPLYANGMISHERGFPELDDQLVNWYDTSVKKDRADSLAMAVSLFTEYRHLLGQPSEVEVAEKTKAIGRVARKMRVI